MVERVFRGVVFRGGVFSGAVFRGAQAARGLRSALLTSPPVGRPVPQTRSVGEPPGRAQRWTSGQGPRSPSGA